jgi:CDP-diacylglycerol--glycerol-3-phosphate 3-phosphatidyltransferase
MMHSPVGRFLVASRFMRAFYGLAKAVVFGFLYLTHALALNNPEISAALHPLNQSLIFLTVGLCVLRGIPVLLDGRIYFATGKKPA